MQEHTWNQTIKRWGIWLFRIVQGALIGSGAILPGISGGVLCVIFGIYQPMVETLAHPSHIKKYWKLFLAVGAGGVLGFFGLAGAINWLFLRSPTLATFLFLGLIVGTLPGLFQTVGKQGRPKSAWLYMALGFSLMLSLLLFLQHGQRAAITPTPFWYLICGALWGVSIVVPGLSSSSFLISLGLYQPMTAGIAALEPTVIGPMLAGLVITVLVLSKGMDRLLQRHYTSMFHTIFGVVAASAVAIIPLSYGSLHEVVLSLGCLAVGFAVAFWMDRLSAKLSPQR